MAVKLLPSDAEIVRYIPFAKLIRDEEDKVLGVRMDAFKLKPNETELSVAGTHCFTAQHLHSAINALRCGMNCSTKSGFAVVSVDVISKYMKSKGRSIRVIHDPDEVNCAHVSIHRWPNDDNLLDDVAACIWDRLEMNCNVPHFNHLIYYNKIWS